jgi:predicted PurR-regulated permease PerM
MAGWSWRLLAVAGAVALLAVVLARIGIVVLPVILAVLFSTLFAPPVRWLRQRGWPASVATLAVLLLAFAAVGGVGYAIAPPLVEEFGELSPDLRKGVDRLAELADRLPGVTSAEADRYVDRIERQLRNSGNALVGGLLSGALLLVEVVGATLLTLVLMFFFLKDGERLWAWVVGLFPLRRRADVDELGRRGYATLGAYLRGVVFVATVDATLIGLGLFLLGVPLVLPLMVLIFVGSFVPIVGAFASGIVAALVALVSDGVGTAAIVVGIIVAVQQLEGNILYPVIMGRAVRLHAAVILLAVAAGGVLWGIAGAFIAVPLAAVGATWLSYVRSRGRIEPAGSG